MRIEEHPILTFKKGRKVEFSFDGEKMWGYEGEPIAAALHANGVRVLRRSIKLNRPRGFYCAIGNCSSCLMKVNGEPNVKVCVEKLKEDMVVETQKGKGDLSTAKISPVSSSREGKRIRKTDIAVIGAGPAGLLAAISAHQMGAKVTLLDRDSKLGGQLIKQTHMFFGSEEQYASIRGIDIADILANKLDREKTDIMLDATVVGYYREDGVLGIEQNNRFIKIKPERIIVATGASERVLAFPNNDLPGIYGAGAAQTLMNEHGVVPGDNVLMVGAGNIGLIVSYQLMQAGINVKAIIDAAPKIGGYWVHASKVRRLGVPIYTSYTVKEAYGKENLEKVTIWELDEDWQPLKGTEMDLDVDVICIAVGLSPLAELLWQAGCQMKYIPELGGHTPVRDEDMQTTTKGIYVAGDVAGVEEASSAMVEGSLAGLCAAKSLGYDTGRFKELKKEAINQLKGLRSGPVSEGIRKGLKQLIELRRKSKND
ncbi:MAG: FAD-dependent oxidoreductase [Candidatus Aerophobetes bacterium]|nr:FAD-dependent oxidoreductase [Candidatus Aerophobetes bacterium]